MTRFRPDIIDDQKRDEDARDRAWLRKKHPKGGGTPPESKARQAIRVSATRRKKVPVSLPKLNFGKD